eukprot:6520980-Prymnesium_polylepis.1
MGWRQHASLGCTRAEKSDEEELTGSGRATGLWHDAGVECPSSALCAATRVLSRHCLPSSVREAPGVKKCGAIKQTRSNSETRSIAHHSSRSI